MRKEKEKRKSNQRSLSSLPLVLPTPSRLQQCSADVSRRGGKGTDMVQSLSCGFTEAAAGSQRVNWMKRLHLIDAAVG